MRSYQEISKELESAIKLVEDKKTELDKANVEYESLVNRANKLRADANSEFSKAQEAAVDIRREMQEYLDILVPVSQQGRVRASG